ncbi:MAG: preprotein translocase subunit SecG [Candidatus Kapaibacterium sp.]|jgi:preprotein translocase subunit SecG|nr:preprotein translocase subunit SecG [Candidatus Kapabacteria bacterium]
MFTVFAILMLILSFLLIGVVLLQPGKGDMISGMSGLGGTFSNMLGSRRATDLLSKITIGLAAGILILSVVTNKFFVGGGADGPKPVTEGVVVPKTVPSSPTQTQIPVPQTQPESEVPVQDEPAKENDK